MPTKTKDLCCSCENDLYNHSPHGGCWMYSSATVVTRTAVGTWNRPPYRWQPVKVLSCFHRNGMHWLPRRYVGVIADTDQAEEKWHATH